MTSGAGSPAAIAETISTTTSSLEPSSTTSQRVKTASGPFVTAAGTDPNVTGVRAEHGVRVHLKAGETYEILSITETRPGTFAVAVEDPDELHNDRPCTIWAQIPADIIS